jgi:hypothetical protein
MCRTTINSSYIQEIVMTRRNLAMCAGVLLVGCASQSDFLDSKQSIAVDTAMSRAKFEMNCPAAQGSVLSRQYIQAPMAGPRMVEVGVNRAEYTIGVSGCGQRLTYVVVCSEGTEGCIAGDGRR